MHFTANRLFWLGFVLSCVSLSLQNRRVKRIVGGKLAAIPPPDDPVVFSKAYNRNSRVEGYRYVSVLRFTINLQIH